MHGRRRKLRERERKKKFGGTPLRKEDLKGELPGEGISKGGDFLGRGVPFPNDQLLRSNSFDLSFCPYHADYEFYIITDLQDLRSSVYRLG